jgi:hypothetical protein
MSASTALQADISANRLGDGGDDTIHPECDRRSSSALPSGLQQRRHGVSIDVVESNCTALLTFWTPVADRVPVGILADYPGETLLDSYDTERYPVAQNDIKFTSHLTWAGTPSGVPRRIRDVVGALSRIGSVRRRMANAAGEVNVSHQGIPIAAGDGPRELLSWTDASSTSCRATTRTQDTTRGAASALVLAIATTPSRTWAGSP